VDRYYALDMAAWWRFEEVGDVQVSVQHFSGGGSFAVEIAVCPSEGHTTSWGAEIAPSKVRAVDINYPRPRLGLRSDLVPATSGSGTAPAPTSMADRRGPAPARCVAQRPAPPPPLVWPVPPGR
jgi:hypothetical protein